MINEEKYREARRMLCRYLYDLAKEKGITHDQIAEKTGFARNNVSRMLAGRYSPSLENFIKLVEAIDKETYDELIETIKNKYSIIEKNK